MNQLGNILLIAIVIVLALGVGIFSVGLPILTIYDNSHMIQHNGAY